MSINHPEMGDGAPGMENRKTILKRERVEFDSVTQQGSAAKPDTTPAPTLRAFPPARQGKEHDFLEVAGMLASQHIQPAKTAIDRVQARK